MRQIDTLLIDDEISAIKTLQGMLKEFAPAVNVVGYANTVEDALIMVQKHQPDLVFLDIEMPPFGSGFDFLQRCRSRQFGVIFATAYPEYAIKAINEVQPWAYIVKPYSVASLLQAVEVALEKTEKQEAAPFYAIPDAQSIVINDARKGNVVIRVKDILYCGADHNSTDLYFVKDGKSAKITSSRTLKDFEEQLPGSMFCRCHHSFLVNLEGIERYERTGRNGAIYFSKGGKIPISVSKMEEFERKFNEYLHIR